MQEMRKYMELADEAGIQADLDVRAAYFNETRQEAKAFKAQQSDQRALFDDNIKVVDAQGNEQEFKLNEIQKKYRESLDRERAGRPVTFDSRGNMSFVYGPPHIPHHSAPIPGRGKSPAWQPSDDLPTQLTRWQRNKLAIGLVDRIAGILKLRERPIANLQKLRYDLQKAVEQQADLPALFKALGPVYQAAVTDQDWEAAFEQVLNDFPAFRQALEQKAPALMAV